MERYTTRDEHGCCVYAPKGSGLDWSYSSNSNDDYTFTGKHIDRLAAYEDTGLTPAAVEDMKRKFDVLKRLAFELEMSYTLNFKKQNEDMCGECANRSNCIKNGKLNSCAGKKFVWYGHKELAYALGISCIAEIGKLVDMFVLNAHEGIARGGGSPGWAEAERSLMLALLRYVTEEDMHHLRYGYVHDIYDDNRKRAGCITIQPILTDSYYEAFIKLINEAGTITDNGKDMLSERFSDFRGRIYGETRLNFDSFVSAPQVVKDIVFETMPNDLKTFFTPDVEDAIHNLRTIL